MYLSILDKPPRSISRSVTPLKIICPLFAGISAILFVASIYHHVPGDLRAKLPSTAFPRITHHLLSSSPKPSTYEAAPRNSTLGFGKIMMIIMPYRTDQRDVATLIAQQTDVDITIVDGISPNDVPPQALPAGGWSGAPGKPGEIGCWRSHMNALQTAVNEGLETALIFEADNDWDVRVKDQMAAISRYMPNATTDAPYGTDWDMLWLGECISSVDPYGPIAPIASWHDETVKRRDEQRQWSVDVLDFFGVSEEQMRMLVPSYGPVCLSAYAVTLRGAEKLLYELSYNRVEAAIDIEINRLTFTRRLDSIEVVPPVMGQYKTGSAADTEINAEDFEKEKIPADQGEPPEGVVKSVRKEVGGMIWQGKEKPAWQPRRRRATAVLGDYVTSKS